MSRYENVLVDADLPLPAFAARIAGVAGSPVEEHGDAFRVDLDDTTSGFVAVADLDDEPHAPFSRYRYLIEVQSVRDGRRDFAAAQQAARRLYERLAAATDWPLLLAFHDGDQVVARRDRTAAA